MELIQIIINSAQESFLHVGVLLGVVILLFGYIDYKTGGNIVGILEKNKKMQPIIGAILGVIPGCGGSIILMPLYVKNKVSFGALVATLIASMGDAAFILISTDIKSYLWVSIISFVTAIICGYIVDMLHIGEKLSLRKDKLHTCDCNNTDQKEFEKGLKINLHPQKHIGHEENDEIDHALHHNETRRISKVMHNFTHSIGYKLFYLFIILGLILNLASGEGLIHTHSHTSSYSEEHVHEEESHTHEEEDTHVHESESHTHEEEHTHDHEEHSHTHEEEDTHVHESESHTHEEEHTHTHEYEIVSIQSLVSVLGIILSIVYTILSKKYIKNTTHEDVESKALSFKEMVIHSASETAFVITWIFVGYLIYNLAVMLLGGEEVLHSIMLVNGILSVIVGAVLGIVPGCGIQVIFITLYSKGIVPFAALIANSISQDGDALFPLIAMDKKSAFWATVLTTIPSIIVGIVIYLIMN